MCILNLLFLLYIVDDREETWVHRKKKLTNLRNLTYLNNQYEAEAHDFNDSTLILLTT